MSRTDDLGYDMTASAGGGGPAGRVVSLVPSLSEALAVTRPDALIGATDWCTHPADLGVERVRGTKNPDIPRIIELAPDLVIANKEENRQVDVERLRDAGVDVWVTDITTVEESISSMIRMFEVGLGWDIPDWLAEVRAAWAGPEAPPTQRTIVPIWRDPWMVVGPDTFTSDLLARLGFANVVAAGDDRYPKMTAAEIDGAGADVILLPDEPYEFTATDGPEAFTATPTRLIDGRLITWYGPSLLEVRAVFGFE